MIRIEPEVYMESEFLNRVKKTTLEHLSDEQFGVSELADEVGMSRSNLLRKIKSETSLSASQFIRNIRLEESREFLQKGDLNISEIARKVGFGSTSYYIKCFREAYGHSPGSAPNQEPVEKSSSNSFRALILVGIVIVVIGASLVLWQGLRTAEPSRPAEKSIAVLPFKNDSPDSSNIYLINGLMENTLNNLQKIKNLRVVSRTSVEPYRNTAKTVPEIAQELPVNYLVEGSGQKVGKQIQLNIQLIETATDKRIWSQQYNREVEDIFQLQQEVANSIVSEIKVMITPEEQLRIEAIPTENLEAYDLFLKGREEISVQSTEGLVQGISYFKRAVELDEEFGVAYAYLAVCYYYMDYFKKDKEYTDQISDFSDKALLYASESPTSMIARGLYNMHLEQYDEAEKYFLKAYEFAPGSADIVNRLSDFYTSYRPNTEKYLEFALRGLRLSTNTSDSVTTSYLYLHLSNALIQTGFVDEALNAINQSLDYFPENPYAYLRAYILYVKNQDLTQTQNILIHEFEKDTSRLDILQEIGKIYYYDHQFDKAYEVYHRFVNLRQTLGLDVYHYEHLKIGDSFIRNGREEEGLALIKSFKDYAEQDKSRYKDGNLAAYYAYHQQLDSSRYYMERFSSVDNFPYWVLLFIEKDPVMAPIVDKVWFQQVLLTMKNRFWKNHDRIKKQLERENLL